jgi:hypothetical protein
MDVPGTRRPSSTSFKTSLAFHLRPVYNSTMQCSEVLKVGRSFRRCRFLAVSGSAFCQKHPPREAAIEIAETEAVIAALTERLQVLRTSQTTVPVG